MRAMTHWLITGASGMLGHDLQSELAKSGDRVTALSKNELDISDRTRVLELLRSAMPDVIINAAAFTKVDDCETNEATATNINGTGVKHLAESANETGAMLVQISTDFVFDGFGVEPYETSDDVAPLSAYGRSKLAGELAAQRALKHQIVRTSWLFGKSGWNFVEAIRKQINLGKGELKVVDDQRGRPTYTPHLAEAIVRLARLGMQHGAARGTFHYADEEECTWFDFAKAIVEELESEGSLPQKVVVHPVTTDEFPRPARRPAYSVLSTDLYSRVTGAKPKAWRDGLREYMGQTRTLNAER